MPGRSATKQASGRACSHAARSVSGPRAGRAQRGLPRFIEGQNQRLMREGGAQNRASTRLNPVRTLQDGGHQAPRGSALSEAPADGRATACAAGQRRLGDQPQHLRALGSGAQRWRAFQPTFDAAAILQPSCSDLAARVCMLCECCSGCQLHPGTLRDPCRLPRAAGAPTDPV